jgi:hypothetical protein
VNKERQDAKKKHAKDAKGKSVEVFRSRGDGTGTPRTLSFAFLASLA